MASFSSSPKYLDLNVAPKTTRDVKVWHPSFVSQNRHRTIDDSMMMNDTTVVIVARNFLTHMDEILLTRRSNEEAIDDSIWLLAFRVLLLFLGWLIALLKLVSSYSIDKQTRVDKLQISNEKILGDHERLKAKLKRRHPLPLEASRT
ncbi:unnamed protein product [Prunus armeniaca]